MRVLIVEDHVKMAGLIQRGLRKEGMAVDVTGDGEEALWMAAATEYDALILDVMLPGADGFEVCRELRSKGVWAPILMLTARDAVRDRVAGLDSGADDYLTKPFSYAELLARLRALVRRGPVERPAELEVGDLRLDPARRRVWRGDTEIQLSPKEFSLLETFMRRPGEVLSRFQLLEHAWDYEYENRSNVVDSYIRLLRNKIDRPFGTTSLETVRGAGYRLQRGRRRVRRIPIKLRVTLVFAAVMAIVLAATGLFLYLRLESSLNRLDRPGPPVAKPAAHQGDAGQQTRASARLPTACSTTGPRSSPRSSLRTGRLFNPPINRPQPTGRPVLPPGKVAEARRGEITFERPGPRREPRARALPRPALRVRGPHADRGRRRLARRSRRSAREPAPTASDRGPDRAPPRVPGGIRDGRRCAAPGGGHAPARLGGVCFRRGPAPAGPGRPTTSFTASARP